MAGVLQVRLKSKGGVGRTVSQNCFSDRATREEPSFSGGGDARKIISRQRMNIARHCGIVHCAGDRGGGRWKGSLKLKLSAMLSLM